MIPPGFLGTRGDLLMDLVILSFFIILPVLIFSWIKVRDGSYALHKRIQVGLGLTLLIAVGLFELDIRLAGGTFQIISESPYADAWWLEWIFYVHLIIATTTTLIWASLIFLSLKKFPSPPQPALGHDRHGGDDPHRAHRLSALLLRLRRIRHGFAV
jgi:putative membrane protein